MTFTQAEIVTALERELKQRRRVYPRLVAAMKMTEKEAAYQVAVFEQIRDEHAEKAKGERLV